MNPQRLPQTAAPIDMQIFHSSLSQESQKAKRSLIQVINAARICFRVCFVLAAALTLLALSPCPAQEVQSVQPKLELSRPIRPWEFLPVTGKRAALFGNESGQMEAWIYPLKLLRDFRLVFHENDHAIPAEVLARTITVRPESATIVYSSDTFTVRETFFVPVKEQGAVISFDIQTEQPLEIETRFVRDFQLEWWSSRWETRSVVLQS